MTQAQKGFTLLELLVVIVMVGVVAAIAVPSWLSFWEKTQMTVARDQLYLGMREAQIKAQSQRTGYQFSVREQQGSIAWLVHSTTTTVPIAAQWTTVDSQSLKIDGETTLNSTSGTYYARFDEQGNPTQLGRLTLSAKRFSKNKRCVIISTLIGAARKSQERPTPDPTYTTGNRFCY
jgi:prepilin-type N-terminal cleavage/methylation domain-containing protein